MRKKIADLFRNKKVIGGCAAIALAVIVGSTALLQGPESIPELPVYTDPIMEVSVEEEETPLASKPKVTTTTNTKSSTTKYTMTKAAKKTQSVKRATVQKTSTRTATSATATITKKTTVTTKRVDKYKKNSKIRTRYTTVTTKVTTTKTPLPTPTPTPAKQGKYEVDVASIAPKADTRVLNAFKTLGFKVYVDSSVSCSGYFDARTRSITLKAADNTIYHELGHFLAFIAGNADTSASFKSVYASEKAKYTGVNKVYVTQNSSEYFAESFKDSILDAGTLQSSRPSTYQAIVAALNKVTTAQISLIQKLYAPVWA